MVLSKDVFVNFWSNDRWQPLDKVESQDSIREYRRGNQKWKFQRNWQHRIHKTKKNKAKPQGNKRWTTTMRK
jgi:hypothetical protein